MVDKNKESTDLRSPFGRQRAGAVHYHDYLQLVTLLQAQLTESSKHGAAAHDEMLFSIAHQAYELWFKQLHHELTSVLDIMRKPVLNNNSALLRRDATTPLML